MDDKTYRNIVALIERYSYQIKVKDPDAYHAFTDLSGSEGRTVPMRCLTLAFAHRYGSYQPGHEWFIALKEMGRTIRRMSSSDTEFMWRVRRHDLTRNDVEKIILSASHGVIRLRMF